MGRRVLLSAKANQNAAFHLDESSTYPDYNAQVRRVIIEARLKPRVCLTLAIKQLAGVVMVQNSIESRLQACRLGCTWLSNAVAVGYDLQTNNPIS